PTKEVRHDQDEQPRRERHGHRPLLGAAARGFRRGGTANDGAHSGAACGQHGRCVQRGRLRLVAGSRWTAPARPRVAVVRAARDQVDYLARAVEEGGPLAYLEPERLVQAYTAPPTEPGARDDKTGADRAQESLTWGLQAIGVQDSAATGAGIRVAVLDTGFTSDHPDFADRDVEVRSFVDGEDASDGHG